MFTSPIVIIVARGSLHVGINCERLLLGADVVPKVKIFHNVYSNGGHRLDECRRHRELKFGICHLKRTIGVGIWVKGLVRTMGLRRIESGTLLNIC